MATVLWSRERSVIVGMKQNVMTSVATGRSLLTVRSVPYGLARSAGHLSVCTHTCTLFCLFMIHTCWDLLFGMGVNGVNIFTGCWYM